MAVHHSARQTLILLFALGAIVTFSYILLRNFQSLTGTVVQNIQLGNHQFVVGTDVTFETPVGIQAGSHGIVTCPSTPPPLGLRMVTPADMSVVTGLKIYEFSAGFADEKLGNWNGLRHGYGQSSGSTLTALAPGKTYYARADITFGFRCWIADAGSSSSAAQSSSSASALLAHWRLEEGPSGNLAPDSAGSNHAAITGSYVWTNQTPAGAGSNWAVNLSGAYLRASGTGSLNFNENDRFSIALWTQRLNDSNDYLIFKIGGVLQGYMLFFDAHGRVNWLMVDTSTTAGFTTISHQRVPPGAYAHLLVTYDGTKPTNQRLQVYVNGMLDTATTIYYPPAITGSTINFAAGGPFDIGRVFGPSKATWHQGYIDDVRVYGTVVTPSDIPGAPPTDLSPSFSPTPPTHLTALVGDQLSHTFTAVDPSPPGDAIRYLLVRQDNMLPIYDVNADGVVDIGDLNAVGMAMNTSPGHPLYLAAADLDGSTGITPADLLGLNSIIVSSSSGFGFDTNTGVMSWTPAANQMGTHRFVVNAYDPNEATYPNVPTPYVAHSFTLTVADLIGHWPVEENGGTVMTDIARGRNGVYSGAVQWVGSTVPGSSFALNTLTTTGTLTLPQIPELDFGRDDPFSISFWMRKTPQANQDAVIVHDVFGLAPGWMIGSITQNNVTFFMNLAQLLVQSPAQSIPANTFDHYLVTYDGKRAATGVTIFINGTQLPVTASQSSLTEIRNAIPITFGRLNLGYVYDEIRVYRGVVKPEDVPN